MRFSHPVSIQRFKVISMVCMMNVRVKYRSCRDVLGETHPDWMESAVASSTHLVLALALYNRLLLALPCGRY